MTAPTPRGVTAEREGEPLTAEPVDVHVRLEGLNRDTAIRLIEDMIYYLKRGTTGYQGFSPGYLGFFPKGADNDSPIAAQTAALLAARREVRALRDALEEIQKEAQRQVTLGKIHRYKTGSEPVGVRGGEIETRVGDLCDMRDAIDCIARAALAATPEGKTNV